MVNDYRLQRRLAMKCFMMYGAIGLFVMSGMLFSNKFVSHATPAQFKSTVLGVAIGYMLLLMLFVLFTTFRLKITVELRSAGAIHSSQLRRQALWQRLTSFPSEFFWFYWSVGFTLAEAYRMLKNGMPPWGEEVAIDVWKGVLFDGSTFLAFAIIHYSLLRWLFRGELKKLELVRLNKPRFHHMTRRFSIIAGCGFFYLSLRLFWYVYQAEKTGALVNWGVFIVIAAVVIGITLIGLRLAGSYMLKDMTRIEERLLQLSVGTANTMKPIAVVSPYEAGELTIAFNKLQYSFSQEYARLQDEIQLGYSLQQRLFPEMELKLGDWTLKGSYIAQDDNRTCFFHLTAHDSQYAAIMAGALNVKGPSASLLLSALLMLFRTQVDEHISSEHMLQRLNQQLIHVLAEGMELQIVIMTLDVENEHVEWAVAGDMRIKLMTTDGCQTIVNCTPPLNSVLTTGFSNGQRMLNELTWFQLEYSEQRDKSYVPLVFGQQDKHDQQGVAGQCTESHGSFHGSSIEVSLK